MTQSKPNTQNTSSDKQLLATVEKMVKVQEKNLELKAKELENEQESIRSNEKIALATIDAQKSDREQQMQVVTKLQTQKHYIIGGIIASIVIIVVVAMFTNNTAFAIEFLKIGGAVLMGYIAGLGHSKLGNKNNEHSNQ